MDKKKSFLEKLRDREKQSTVSEGSTPKSMWKDVIGKLGGQDLEQEGGQDLEQEGGPRFSKVGTRQIKPVLEGHPAGSKPIKNRIQYLARVAAQLPFEMFGSEAFEKAFSDSASKLKVNTSTALMILDRRYLATVKTLDDPSWRLDIADRLFKFNSRDNKQVAAGVLSGGAIWEKQRAGRSALLLDAVVVIQSVKGSCPEAVIDEIAERLKVPSSVVSLVKSISSSTELAMSTPVYDRIEALLGK